MLSIIIPSCNDPYLNRTIRSVIWNKKREVEVIPILDGTSEEVYEQHRVHPIYLPETRGLANAVELGVKMARGELIMKVDAHCKFAPGFDLELNPAENEVMIPRRYQLDVERWEIMQDELPVDYEKLVIHPRYHKFHGTVWRSRQRERADFPIDETMMFQGSCWVMHKKWYEQIQPFVDSVGLQMPQEPLDIAMKTWMNGGRLMVNKNTWYAHKHKSFSRTYDAKHDAELWSDNIDKYLKYYETVVKPRFYGVQ